MFTPESHLSKAFVALLLAATCKAEVIPKVKGTPQVLGIVMDPRLNRDSCGSVKLGGRAFWTCRDTQHFNSDGTVNKDSVITSTASWTNFSSDGKPDIQASLGYQSYSGLPMYGADSSQPYYTYLSEDCGSSTAGACPDGTRFAIWPDSPPMVASSTGDSTVSYTWIRRSHIKQDLSTVVSDPATTLYRVTYQNSATSDTLPQVAIVDGSFWAENEIAYGNYGNVVKDGIAYLYGQPSNRIVSLAKVPVDQIEDKSKYQYWVNGAWTSTQPSINGTGVDIANASAGGQGTYYYSDIWQSYVWIGQAAYSVAADFYITTAPEPQGPWIKPMHFYSGVNGNFSLGAYTLQANPALTNSGQNEMYITYTKNDYINDVSVYTTPLIYVEWQ